MLLDVLNANIHQYTTGHHVYKSHLLLIGGPSSVDGVNQNLVGVDFSDPTNLSISYQIPSWPGRYVQFQDEYGFGTRYGRGWKYNFETDQLALEFSPPDGQLFSDFYPMPVGHLLLTSGDVDRTFIIAHQDGVDARAPSVAYHLPADGAVNQAVTSRIGILVHETLDDTTVNSANILVEPVGGGDPVQGLVSITDYDVITFAPHQALAPNKTYQVTVLAGGIKDAAGNGIDGYSFRFSTGSTVAGGGNLRPTAVISASPLSGTAPLLVSFDGTASSDPEGDPLTYSWNFGDGSSGTGALVDHSYTAAGNYTVRLTVQDGNGGSGTAQIPVSVLPEGGANQWPVAAFSASPLSGVAPLTVSFDATASSDADGDPLTYLWDFGDGGANTGALDNHVFNSAGRYTVALTVDDGNGGSNTTSTTIDVFPPNTVGTREGFEDYVSGADPVGWLDTGANNSMVEEDTLFGVLDLGSGKAFGTSSTATNIHSHLTAPDIAALSGYDYSGLMMVTDGAAGAGVTVFSQYATADAYYRLRRNSGNRAFHFSPHGTSLVGDLDTGVVPSANVWYRFRIQVEDTGARTEVRAKIWADGQAEPADWQAEAYDESTSRLVSGAVGLWSMGAGQKLWDDLTVVALNASSPPTIPPAPANLPPTIQAVSATPAFISDRAGESAALSVTAVDPDGDDAALAYAWSLPAGAGTVDDPSSATPAYSPPNVARTEQFTLSVEVTDPDGGVATGSTTISVGEWVEPPPVVTPLSFQSLTHSPTSPVAVGASVAFTADVVGGEGSLTYSWDFGDGTEVPAGSGTASHAYTAPGRYLVVVQVRDTAGGIVTRSARLVVEAPITGAQPTRSTPIAVDETGRILWVVNPDNDTVTAIDADTLAVLSETPVGAHPASVAIDSLGRAWIACRDEDSLWVLDGPDDPQPATVDLDWGAAPVAIVFPPDGSVAYVAAEQRGEVIEIDPMLLAIGRTVEVGPRPRALAVTGDGNRLLVSRLISPDHAGYVATVDLNIFSAGPSIELPVDTTTIDATNAGRGVPNYLVGLAVHPLNETAWVVSKKDNILRGGFRDGQPLTFETTSRALISTLDLMSNDEQVGLRNDIDNHGFPSAVAFSASGNFAFVTMQGNNRVIAWDVFAGIELTRADTGLAPRGVAIDEVTQRVFTKDFTARTVSVFDAAALLSRGESSLPLIGTLNTVSREQLSAQELLGLQVFYNAADARMAMDGYLSCASCHLDGGDDGRVWDLSDRGEGLRNTISLIGHAGDATAPLHWSGNFDEIQDFEHDIRNAFGGTGFMSDADFNAGTRNTPLGDRKSGLTAELDALAAYVNSLSDSGRSPSRDFNGNMTAGALEGEAIFASLQCGSCHGGVRFANSGIGASVILEEGFEAYVAGEQPKDWLDTRQRNSMVEDDSLFQVFDLSGTKVFGTASRGTNIHSHYGGTGIDGLGGYEYQGRLMITQGSQGVGVTAFSQYPASDAYYRLRSYDDRPSFHFSPHPHGAVTLAGDLDTGVVPLPNVWYRFRFQVEDLGTQTEIRAKVWAAGEAEPADWQAQASDASATRLTSGKIGLWSMGNDNKYWDDLAVYPLNGAGDSAAQTSLHDVGTLKLESGQRLGGVLDGLDTPTLLGLWSTAPYLHDGSAATLRDVLVKANSSGLHGDTSSLTPAELDNLIEYLLQLEFHP
jgi:YVTN family beta-propeller protein